MVASEAAAAPKSFAFGPFVLCPARRLLLRDGQPVRIGGRALNLLNVLIERRGELVTKRELIALAWPDVHVDDVNLKANMLLLRRALVDPHVSAHYVATVIGRGYQFVAPVEVRQSDIGIPPALSGPLGRGGQGSDVWRGWEAAAFSDPAFVAVRNGRILLDLPLPESSGIVGAIVITAVIDSRTDTYLADGRRHGVAVQMAPGRS